MRVSCGHFLGLLFVVCASARHWISLDPAQVAGFQCKFLGSNATGLRLMQVVGLQCKSMGASECLGAQYSRSLLFLWGVFDELVWKLWLLERFRLRFLGLSGAPLLVLVRWLELSVGHQLARRAI